MNPLSLQQLTSWIINEYQQQSSLFGIPSKLFFKPTNFPPVNLSGNLVGVPLGPAAGPHTQLAQNILTAFLCGGRYFELKTVQVLDELEIAKPCIDAENEGYNTEWSTELSISQALDEYTKAYLLVHCLGRWLGLPTDFVFNLSVGYDLRGIQSAKVDAFIEQLKDARLNPAFDHYRQELQHISSIFSNWQLPSDFADVSPVVANSITLSTMHGCPPAEIEAIARYLIADKGLHTYVKLNPTLLGLEKVRHLLDTNGFPFVELFPESFEKDLQYDQALQLIARLMEWAKRHGRHFGVKLSNTLPVRNRKVYLPGAEMYLSGAALYPLTITLAAQLARDFDGQIAISYSGGITANNVCQVLKTGIRPVTVATDLLKPGGYLRLRQMVQAVSNLNQPLPEQLDLAALDRLAEEVAGSKRATQFLIAQPSRKIARNLPPWDCFIAPCQAHCPIHQSVPCYLAYLHEHQAPEALRLILRNNPLPNITGHICDHQCETKCVRHFYEAPLAIRDMKRLSADEGWATILPEVKPMKRQLDSRVAIIGGGPAGLATAFFLAREGYQVTVFDQNAQMGGTVRYLIPSFRLPQQAIDRDIELLQRLGVELVHNVRIEGDLRLLHAQGFKYIVLAVGAVRPNHLTIEGARAVQLEALDFLRRFNTQSETLQLGKQVVVIGGGNSAIDAARAAKRIRGVEQVTLIYRRTVELMPADREEIEQALLEDIRIRELLIPVRYLAGNILLCQRMQLSECDSSGRPRPMPVPGAMVEIPADKIITALGERVDLSGIATPGLVCEPDGRIQTNPESLETSIPNIFAGGDACRGPATVVAAIADAQKIATAICREDGIALDFEATKPEKVPIDFETLFNNRGRLKPPRLAKDFSPSYQEGERCLHCDFLCGRCVEVCPNRANLLIPVDADLFQDRWQIVHLDYLCNACGNCATFCPYQGWPYRDKFTVFKNLSNYQESQANGIYLDSSGRIYARENGRNMLFSGLPELRTALGLTEPMKALITQLLTRFQYLFE